MRTGKADNDYDDYDDDDAEVRRPNPLSLVLTGRLSARTFEGLSLEFKPADILTM